MDNENKVSVPKKTPKLVWRVMGIIVFFIFLVLLTASLQSSPQPVSSTTPVENLPVSVCSNFKISEAKNISFKELDKSPDSFKGQLVKFTGQVVEISESEGKGYMRLAVTKTDYGWSPADIIWVGYEGHTDAVTDDVVSVYGPVSGAFTYTSQANYTITIPRIDGCVIKKPGTTNISSAKTIKPIVAPVVAPAPQVPTTAPVLAWHTAYTYSNNVNIKTPSFTMKGSKWRVTYSCTTNPDVAAEGMTGNFYGYIYSADSGSMATNFASFVDCPKSDTSYVYAQSPGQYYLDIMSPSSSYTVTVEDYY